MRLIPDDEIGKERKELDSWRQMEEQLAKRPSSSWGTLGRKRCPAALPSTCERCEAKDAEIRQLKAARAKAYQHGIDDTLAELEIADRARYYREDR